MFGKGLGFMEAATTQLNLASSAQHSVPEKTLRSKSNGKSNGNYYVIVYRGDIGTYSDNGKENGNYHVVGFRF